jgi:superfamily II DNA/RNA helicase
MAETADQVLKKLNSLIQPKIRERLNARGHARAMVWRNGILPDGSPNLGPLLTEELLSYGFGLLRLALKARNLNVFDESVLRAFELAAESLESVVRNGSPKDEARGFYRVVAAASYHLGRYSARAYSLLTQALGDENLAIIERALALLILRRLDDLFLLILQEVTSQKNSDDLVAQRLKNSEDPFNLDDALTAAVTENYLRALAAFFFALRADEQVILDTSQERLTDGEELCFKTGLVSMWWICRLTRFLTQDLWKLSIQQLLPVDSGDNSEWHSLRELFVALLARRATAELDLWPSQLDAVSRIVDTRDDLIASLPTSAGKTRIAEMCILRTLSLGQRIVFVTPLRALSAQTERILRNTFGPLGFDVSSLYGSAGASSVDLDSLGNRHIVVSTPEKLDFALRNDANLLNDVGLIVLDEGHMLGPTERGVRYEVLIQRFLKRPDSSSRRIVCLSAMFPSGDQMDDFVNWLRDEDPGGPIMSLWRPTRQRFGQIIWTGGVARYELKIEDQTTFIPRFIELQEKVGPKGGKKRFPGQQNDLVLACAWRLVREKLSVLIYCPERRSVNAVAKRLIESHKQRFLDPLPGFDVSVVDKAIALGKEWLGNDHPVVKSLSLGVAIHHAGLPRPFLREIDVLIREKHIPIIVASPTLARGLNISASCVLFQSCQRFDHSKQLRLPISQEEFSNVSGRAGRAYVDLDGQALGVCFTPDQLEDWKALVAQQAKRNLESGLIELMIPLFQGLKRKLGGGDIKDVIEYVVNNSGVWDDPPGDENEISEWTDALTTLDIALLSLIGEEECSPDDVANVLDKVLTSSFLRRRLQRYKEIYQRFVTEILTARARHICSNTSPRQRRGYFFAGVGLTAGYLLDSNSKELNAALVDANEAMQNGKDALCIEAVLKIAERIFDVEPFRPRALPEKWKEIVIGWLAGSPMSSLQSISEDVPMFIEDAIVYRLVWALEAIRVRSRANNEGIFGDNPSPIVAAIETGTLSITEAILLQTGLGSRIAASKSLADFPAQFETVREMRKWLFSDPVVEATKSDSWPTPESRHAWLDYIESQRAAYRNKWSVSEQAIPVSFIGSVKKGEYVFVWQPPDNPTIHVFTPELIDVGKSDNHFESWATPWALGRVIDKDTVKIRYVGPVPS